MELEFWKDKGKKQIDPELFSTKAESLANQISSESSDRTNNPTQVRKFYDEVLRFDCMLKTIPEENQREEFGKLLPYIKMLNAKAAYALGRNELVSQGFKDFINTAVKKVNDKDDFDAFTGFFEAFMGFYKFAYKNKKERNLTGGRR